MKFGGTFNGTGAAVYLCAGLVPDCVEINALEDGDLARVFWSRVFRAAEVIEGVSYVGSSAALQVAALTVGTGVQPYEGGEILTSANQTSVAYGEGVFLGWDDADYKQNLTSGFQSAVSKWTLDTTANKTGHFDADSVSSGGKVGEGSEILILANGILYKTVIVALTAGQGIAADEVTLARAIPSGQVMKTGGMYNFAPIALGKTTPAGVKINKTTLINVNDEINSIEFCSYDEGK